ncbi:MAG TPA: TVP38/TMEM64 family protein [Longimicrobiaceae bacterium]|nr:TVP38/TMEM64 family protein [Longimicrobiaceae bacterium]
MKVDWRRASLLAVLAGGLAAFFLLGGPRWLSFETIREHREALRAYTDRNYAAVLAGASLAYAAATALSVPLGVFMTMAMGFLFGRWVGTAAVTLAATVGATGAFLAARYLFADAARRRMGRALQKVADGFRRDAFNYLLFLRLVPVFPFWLVNLAPALADVRVRTFFLATLVGILPGTFVFVYLGESLATIDRPGDLLSADVLLSLTLLGVLALIPVAMKKLRTREPGASA